MFLLAINLAKIGVYFGIYMIIGMIITFTLCRLFKRNKELEEEILKNCDETWFMNK